MSTHDDGGPAFPSGKSEKPGYENTLPYYEGMTLRDWFAGQALQGLLASGPPAWIHGFAEHRSQSAAAAYLMADAMLAARNNLP